MTTAGNGFQDPACYPGTRVLRNNFDERDPARLAEIETAITAWEQQRIAESPLPGRYDLAHLQAFHRQIFSRVYPWAGQLRTVDISKGGTTFHPHTRLELAAGYVFGELAGGDPLRGLPRDQFVHTLATALGHVNELHPFRDGNGRSQRAFFGQLAHHCGWHLAWEKLDPEHNIAVSRAAHNDPTAGDLAAMLDTLLERTGRPSANATTAPTGATHRPTTQAHTRDEATGTAGSTPPGTMPCGRCGRPLRSGESIARGYGRTCARKA